HELQRRKLPRELMVLMHKRPDPVGMGPEWSNDADGSVVSFFNDQLPHLRDDGLRLRHIESAACWRPHHFASHIHPSHRWPGRRRTLQLFMIRRNPKPAAIKMPVRKRDDVAVGAVMIAKVHDILVAAQAAGEVEQ